MNSALDLKCEFEATMSIEYRSQDVVTRTFRRSQQALVAGEERSLKKEGCKGSGREGRRSDSTRATV